MAQPISKEIRKAIITHKSNQAKEEDIARWLIISKSTVTKVWALYRQTGSYLPRPRTQGRKSAVSASVMVSIEEAIKNTPDMTLTELINGFNLHLTESALSRKLKKRGYSFKKRLLIRQRKTALMSKKNAAGSKSS